MKHSLLFIPDISGFTKFIQSTEASHSQHVIAELLEILIDSNITNLELAEIQGDALFFYKEEDTLSQEMLLSQIEHTFTAFYSHLKMLEANRICPCIACATAPDLELKIVVHCGDLQFIEVQGNRKPFGQQVIEAHRMLKNSISSDNYAMISSVLADGIGLPRNYKSKLYSFEQGVDSYDGNEMDYVYSLIEPSNLKLRPVRETIHMTFDKAPDYSFTKNYQVSADRLLEVISNYRIKQEWAPGVDRFEYAENEVTRKGSEHVCVIDGKRLKFVVVTTHAEPDQLVYGEMTSSPPPVDELVQMFYIDPTGESSCQMRLDIYLRAKSPLKRLILRLGLKNFFKKSTIHALDALDSYLNTESKAT